MALILNIETATRTCSAALGRDGEILAVREATREHFSHAEELDRFIQDVLEEGGRSFQELDAIAVGSGPGSYTGLRIGVSTAKGLAYALGVPLIGLRTLRVMAQGMLRSQEVRGAERLVPMLDARRNEVYCSVHDAEGETVHSEIALDLGTDPVPGIEGVEGLVFFGSGARKAENLLEKGRGARFLPEEHPSASDMVELAEESYQGGRFEDLFSFEPFYLKDFVPTTPKGGKGGE